VGLKVDSSFLKFVTMGALGARRVCELMANAGLQPIELERYSRSNKIWSTKVKRLRLPDLLCVRTGLRVEVRAKSKLTIKMSDAPTKPDRRWNTGLAPRDMIAFVLIREAEDDTLHAAENAELFGLRTCKHPRTTADSAHQSRQAKAQSATESGPLSSQATTASFKPLTTPASQHAWRAGATKPISFAARPPTAPLDKHF